MLSKFIIELTEVITAAEFHPNLCHHFAYSSSKGIIRLCDMRGSALCDNSAKGYLLIFHKVCGVSQKSAPALFKNLKSL